tara:strand:+ start:3772 stop:4248 length:477 start_codon:yes stop_codon:yes gene_type:complete
MELTKRCFNCKKTKPINKFNKNVDKKDGRQYRCVPCQHKYHSTWYQRNKERIKKENKAKKKRRKILHWTRIVERYYRKGCVDCGIKNVKLLEFDHVKGNKKNGVGTMVAENYGWKAIKKEIEKCEVRCRNCHRLKTWKQFNWHKDVKAFFEDLPTEEN